MTTINDNLDIYFAIASFAFIFLSLLFSTRLNRNYILCTQIALVIFYNPVSNKMLAAITIGQLIYVIFFEFSHLKNIRGASVMFLISFLMLFSGSIGLTLSSSFEINQWGSIVLSPVVTGPLFAISILTQLETCGSVIDNLYLYAKLRIIETGLIGIAIYMFFQNEMQLLKALLTGYIRLDVDDTIRLISLSTRNANEAAFLILPATIFVYHIKSCNLYFRQFFLWVSIVAMILTWTRSSLIILPFALMLLILAQSATLKKLLSFLLVTVGIGLIFIGYAFVKDPARLLTTETVDLRFTQYSQYISSIGSINFINGIIEDIWTRVGILNITYFISSENVFIEYLIKYGIFTGFIIIALFFYIAISSIFLLSKLIALPARDKKKSADISIILIVFLALFFMANTSSFEQVSMVWVLGLMVLQIRLYRGNLLFLADRVNLSHKNAQEEI